MDESTRRKLIVATQPLLAAGDWTAIENLWLPFAQAGDVDAQGDLACFYACYGFDEGAATNREMHDLLCTAATKGHANAAYALAGSHPHGSERDRLIQRAGELGSPEAQRDLGALYATGEWTGPKDLCKAQSWYRRAAERGNSEAQYNLGFMCLLGEGSAPNVGEALRWLGLAADSGDVSATRLLAELHRNGSHGVPQNLEMAEVYENRASAQR